MPLKFSIEFTNWLFKFDAVCWLHMHQNYFDEIDRTWVAGENDSLNSVACALYIITVWRPKKKLVHILPSTDFKFHEHFIVVLLITRLTIIGLKKYSWQRRVYMARINVSACRFLNIYKLLSTVNEWKFSSILVALQQFMYVIFSLVQHRHTGIGHLSSLSESVSFQVNFFWNCYYGEKLWILTILNVSSILLERLCDVCSLLTFWLLLLKY